MLIKEDLEKRVAEIQAAIDQSAANHNMLLGHVTEAKYLLDKIKAEKSEAEKIEAEDEAKKKETEGVEDAP